MTSSPDEQLLVSAQNVSKNFGVVQALKSASLDVRRNEVHALFGANGAGKSTLARIICGHIAKSSGTLEICGVNGGFSRPREAIDAGVSIVTQETSIAGNLSVWENIVLPIYGARGRFRRKALRDKAAATIEALGFSDVLSVDETCDAISAAGRQLVEIARSVALNCDVIIFDEPTTTLSPSETGRLFHTMERLRDQGHGMIFVSHRLEEIFSITDRISVLRDGETVAQDLETRALDQAQLINLMFGRDMSADLQGFTKASDGPKEDAKIVLSVQGLGSGRELQDASFDIKEGEVVGLGGLVGAGRSELAEALVGLRPAQSGTVTIAGDTYTPSTPAHAIRSGIGYLPEDRRRQSIIPDFTVRENILMSHLGHKTGAALNYASQAARIEELADRIKLQKDRLSESSMFNFSGGMQQKALLIRALLMSPRVLILDEPTKGIDVGSRATIYALLRELSKSGLSILLISSDFEELLALSHRVIPISDGVTIGSLPASELDEEMLTLIAAPRSSLRQQQELLDKLAERFATECCWMMQSGQRVICLAASEGSKIAQAGEVTDLNGSVFQACLKAGTGKLADGLGAIALPTKNPRGVHMGYIVAKTDDVRAGTFVETTHAQIAALSSGNLQLDLPRPEDVTITEAGP